MTQVEILSPAKVNLGLRILGKRPDGFHDIHTVMAMIDLADRLTVFEDADRSNGIVEGVEGADNLIRRALDAFHDRAPNSPRLGWSIEKRIPAAAGLGGASSNAAAALLCANHLSGNQLSLQELHDLAATLGSDIPFFLHGPVALATGRGTDLAPLPDMEGEILVILPNLQSTGKTASMYGSLKASDFSNPLDLDEPVASAAGVPLAPERLPNAFDRPALERWPILGEIWEWLDQSGPLRYGLSGAGPATFVLTTDRAQTLALEQATLLEFPDRVHAYATRLRSNPLRVCESPGD